MENILPFWNMTVSYMTFEERELKEPTEAQKASDTPTSTRGDEGEGRQGNFSFPMCNDDLCVDPLFLLSNLMLWRPCTFAMNAAKNLKKLF
jgi:hypothetical protein